jgi:RHS repeat-associated protein
MTITPDNSGRVANIKAVTGAVTHSDLSYTYSRLVGGTPTDGGLTQTRTDNQATGSAGKTTTYIYDTLARLTSAVEKDTLGTTTTASWTYGYDNAGNRQSATLSPQGTGGTTAFTYNNANEILTRAGSGTGWSYDANGAETAAVGATTRTTGTWNPKLQNTSTTVAGTAQARTYTGIGNSTRLSAGSTTYRNTALGVTAQTITSVTTNYVREPGGNLVALRTAAGASYYYIYDGLGSVAGLISSSGTKSNSYTYDPYGQSRAKTEAVTNPWQYTSGYLDTATGLYKLGIRYYDPNLGRFTQPDPTGLSVHYVYAANAPVSFVDPTGAGIFGTLFGSFFGGISIGQIITDVAHGDISHALANDLLSIGISTATLLACEGVLAAASVPTAGGALAVGSAGCLVLSEALGNAIASQF